MARIKIGNQVFTSKSDAARHLLDEGMKVKDIEREMTRLKAPMGYAFIYGVAKRAGKAATAADRKSTKVAVVTADEVTIRTDAGVRIVNRTTGKMTKGR